MPQDKVMQVSAMADQMLLDAKNPESAGNRRIEIMVLTPAIRNIIREGKTHQIDGMIYTSTNENYVSDGYQYFPPLSKRHHR